MIYPEMGFCRVVRAFNGASSGSLILNTGSGMYVMMCERDVFIITLSEVTID